jgi:hypothetical protein
MSALFLKHPKETDLALFAGGEAGPFARWRIERHVESCAHCEQTVADYFHLADELSVLAETPEVDWTAMSADIRARVANDTAEPERRGTPAWMWELGAAAACAVVAVAVWQIGPQAKESSAPKEERALADKVQIAQDRLEQKQVARSISAPVADAPPAERDQAKENEIAGQAGSTRQLARLEAGAGAVEPKPEALLEKKKDSPAPETLALADRVDEALPTDTAAPPPPAAKTEALKVAAAEADAAPLVAEDRRAREQTAGGRAMVAGAPPPPPPPALRALSGFAGNIAAAQPASFRVEPLPPAGSDRQVGGGGWISIRAVNADGALTITDVYEPQ